jgi:hypothetical protein
MDPAVLTEVANTLDTSETGGVYLQRLPGGNEVEICNPTPAILAAVERVGEDDPPVCLDWNFANLSAALAWANQQQSPLPSWYNAAGVYPITVAGVQEGLARLLAQAGSGTQHGTVLLAPNTLPEFTRIEQLIRDLMLTDAFLMAMCGNGRAPLARVYVIYDGKRQTTGVHMPMLPLPPGAGVQVFG